MTGIFTPKAQQAKEQILDRMDSTSGPSEKEDYELQESR
jgi:hypothetical protein